ncbi:MULTISPECIES: DUF899 domain-containing protein [Mycobacterium]|uniref:DUF899 domain-containing protein n=1 Tax=Mycobacterium TaxID=1763 RepID=UPI001EF0A34B|nr:MULTISPECIES: DUF899 family protein [Mycobacterium]
MRTAALPPVVDQRTWERELQALRVREKAATRELDAIAAQRRRLPMVAMPEYTLEGEDGPVRLVDIFDGKSQLIVYHHMWFAGQEWQCPGCTGLTSQYTRLEFLDNWDARFVVVTQGPIDEALAYKARVGNQMTWYSTANSPFGADVDAPAGGGFGVNVFLRAGDNVYRTWHTNGRGTELMQHVFGLLDLLPYGRQEEWQDSPDGWPQSPTFSRWGSSQDIARAYGKDAR